MWPFKSAQEAKTTEFSPSPEMIEEARRNPGGWVYQIVGNFGPQDRVPPEAIKGAFKVDGSGKLTGEFKPNPNYRGGL